MLQNNRGLWKSNDMWNFKSHPNSTLIRIENINKTKVWGTKNGRVILEKFNDDKHGQLWRKGKQAPGGYFTIESYKDPLWFVTATSSTSLKLKGNMTLKARVSEEILKLHSHSLSFSRGHVSNFPSS